MNEAEIRDMNIEYIFDYGFCGPIVSSMKHVDEKRHGIRNDYLKQ